MHQHVSKYYAHRHPPLTLGVKIQLFLEHGHVAYQRELGMQQHVANADRGTIKMKHIKRDFWPKACVSVSGIECRRPHIRHLMQESVLQTTDAGVSISDKGLYAFIWSSGECFSIANHARKSLYYKQLLQELLCQTPGYSASLTEDCNRQWVHECLYQTHVQILKVLSEGSKPHWKCTIILPVKCKLNALLVGRWWADIECLIGSNMIF